MEIYLYFPGFGAEPDENELRSRMRGERNRLLSECDWTQLPDSNVDKTAWAEYRQALRDAPDSWVPATVWIAPDKPS
jgi:hypothetical protein